MNNITNAPSLRLARAFSFLALLAALTGCGGGGGGGSRGAVTATPATPSTPTSTSTPGQSGITVSGRVVDTDGAPISGASIKIPNGATLTSAADGSFSFAPGAASEVKISATRGGYIDAFDTLQISPSLAQNGKISATVTMRRAASDPTKATAATITRSDGSTQTVTPTALSAGGLTVYESVVQIGANDRSVSFTAPSAEPGAAPNVAFTIGAADGSSPNASAVLGKSGAFSASIEYGSPLDQNDLSIFPGDFTTNSDTGYGPSGESVLITAGFARITLKDSSGAPVTQFAPGASATIEMTVPEGAMNPETKLIVRPGDTIPIFVFNESTGEWVVEHNADGTVKRSTVQNDNTGRMFVKFTTTHLTWYNLDWKGELCPQGKPKVSFVGISGNPVNDIVVYTQYIGFVNYHNMQQSKESYVEFMRAPADISWKVWAVKDGQTSEVVTITECKDATVVLKPPKPACSSPSDCDDKNALTYDKCINPGELISYCLNNPCMPVCSSDASCDDGKSTTTDTCSAAGTCSSFCKHESCPVTCSSDASCNDGNNLTTDACSNPGTCSASCSHTACSPACSSSSQCDDANPLTADTCSAAGTCNATCAHTACSAACSSDSQCNDNNSLTTDTCLNPGTCAASCSNIACTPACSSNASCNDNNPLTTDTCSNPGTCSAACSHAQCPVACSSDSSCSDNNPLTTDTCLNPGTCSASCSHTQCIVACTSDSQCNDNNPNTTDTCSSGGTCSAACLHPASTCSLFLDRVNYVPGETMTIIFTVSNAGDSPVLCGAESALKRGHGVTSWKSFDESLYVSIPPHTDTTTLTMQKVVPLDWTGTDTSQGSDYDIYPVHFGGERWGAGDNFNLHFKRAACSTNSDCDDKNAATTDTCINPALYDATCVNAACTPTCTANASCDDGNPLTLDICNSPATCSSSCSNTVCTPACTANSSCDDNNPLTTDSCTSPNTCSAACTFTPCTAACTNNAQCNDGNPLTLDTCSNANTCSAACAHTSCTPTCTSDSGCNDNNALTTDACVSPNTCSASCTHTACTPACTADSGCNDNNALTIDSCSNPNTCSASCTHTTCSPACTTDSGCNDNNSLTIDTCSNPNTCSASCTHTTCTPACTSDSGCNDNNALTTDSCVAPNTCNAVCNHTSCSPACTTSADCNDNNTRTADTCNNPNTCSASCVNTPLPNMPPIATASASISTGQAPLTVGFTSTCSDPDGICVSFSWNFGDGSPAASTQNATHTYTTNGTYTAVLTATDDSGATATIAKTITPYQAPSGSITASVSRGAAPLAVNFTYNCVDDGSCVSFIWDFGDVSPTSSLQNPSHTFNDSRFHTISLTVTDNDGHSTTLYTSISTKANDTLSAGNGHSCAIVAGGVKCWGTNNAGQLGNGTTSNYSATPSYVLSLPSGISAVSTGLNFTCALTSTGGVKCWGDNSGGQLGDGTNINRLTPVDVSGLSSGVIAISAGGYHACALLSTGGVKCWGNNIYGQLGNGYTSNRLAPDDVSGLSSGVVTISAGYSNTCALTTAGTVKCWGLNNNGQLGDGTTANRIIPANVAGITTDATALSSGGGGHTCAVVSGAVKCWGQNDYGQLGDGTTNNRNTPITVTGLPTGIASVESGAYHTCALLNSGAVKCWGVGIHGELGNSSKANSPTPVDVTGLSIGVIEISTFGYHTCVVTTTGATKCWGDGSNGQIGSSLVNSATTPSDVNGMLPAISAVSIPNFYSDLYSCAIASGGVKCWGGNNNGCLGDGTYTTRFAPSWVSGLSSGVLSVSTGGNHACALTTAGGVKCWGRNYYGQLGDGTTTDSATPVDVAGFASGVISISAGSFSTCALKSTGAVYCWGFNGYGQIGDGTYTDQYTPRAVSGITSGATAISIGNAHTCAIVADAVKCWGDNTYGELGDGTTTSKLIPTAVSAITSGATVVSAGYNHTCAVVSGGVKCWGDNVGGQLGDGTTSSRSTPVSVSGLLAGVSGVSAGASYTCATTSSGAARCWGYNHYSQIGDGTNTIYVLAPVTPSGLASGVSSITAGTSNTCAITTAGALKCWGDNSSGQLGLNPGWAPVDVPGL